MKARDYRIRQGIGNATLAVLVSLVMMVFASSAQAARIKDVVAFEGIRDNLLLGYGLVVGLNGTGDKLQNNAFTEQSLIGFLERQGVNTRGVQLKSKNVAAVTVTAKLPPFARAGGGIDVSISALGDAKSLLGGTLLATSLYGPDGNVYAVGQGPVTIGGFEASGSSGSGITKGVPTNGFISNGATVEREIDFRLNDMASVRLSLRNPDITTASNVMRVINQQVGAGVSRVDDPGTVTVTVPTAYKGDVVGLLADIETLAVATDQPARIVVDEATGTIVMGENVRISTVAVAQGNLIVKVEETPQVSQPNPFAPEGAETVVVPRSDVTVTEQSGNKIAVLQEGATLKDLVGGLNALGVGPRDLITILQTIKAAGALQADIETR
ncbi:MAG: flagellar basal body P-ring protein FlgI [Rickettsiales bacterium]|nr:flagellar basal body P-ring protein FlgI [Rickettsiales bacterium]